MHLSQVIKRQPTKPKKGKVRTRKAGMPLPVHRAFVPMVTAWGASVLGLSVAVLPADLIARVSVQTSTGFLGAMAMPAFAAGSAVLGGAIGFVIAAAIRERALKGTDHSSLLSAVASRRERLIDPASDLGSESLDSPIEDAAFADMDEIEDSIEAALAADAADESAQPTLGELSQRGYEIEAPEDCTAATDEDDTAFTRKDFRNALIETCEANGCEAEGPDDEPASTLPDAPRALDLGEFGELPGRNAVWVEEPIEEALEQPDEPVPAPSTALERLRQRKPADLSLVEMVERFAGALHERQQAEAARPSSKESGRDAALAEALKALTLFTEHGFDQPQPAPAQGQQAAQIGETERELRMALAKLQTLSGAA